MGGAVRKAVTQTFGTGDVAKLYGDILAVGSGGDAVDSAVEELNREKTGAKEAMNREAAKAEASQAKREAQIVEQDKKTETSKGVSQARSRQRQKALSSKSSGRKGTILTTAASEIGGSPFGDSQKTGGKTLLGV